MESEIDPRLFERMMDADSWHHELGDIEVPIFSVLESEVRPLLDIGDIKSAIKIVDDKMGKLGFFWNEEFQAYETKV